MYAECLPGSLTENTARQVITVAQPYPCLAKLVGMCQLYLKNMALKQRKYTEMSVNVKLNVIMCNHFLEIIGLVSDMHACANQIIEHFNNRHSQSAADNITSNPAKLCNVVKQSVRETAVGTSLKSTP